jgi:predicted transcriptional regulator
LPPSHTKYIAFDSCEDVTDKIITGPPGHKAQAETGGQMQSEEDQSKAIMVGVYNKSKGSVIGFVDASPFAEEVGLTGAQKIHLIRSLCNQGLLDLQELRDERCIVKLTDRGRETMREILASEMPFSPSIPHVNIGSIGNFTGNLASNISAHNLQISSFSSINEQLKAVGVSQQERNELEILMDDLKAAKQEDKPWLFQRGMNWVNRNKSALGTLAAMLSSWFEHHGK